MITVTSLAHVALYCRDVEASADFYTRVLGLKRLFTQRKPDGSLFYIYLHAGGRTFIELFPLASADMPKPAPAAGVAHMCLSVENINDAAGSIRQAGWALDGEPRKGTDGNWQVWLEDPDGVRIELMQMMPDCLQYRALEEEGLD